MLKIQAKIQIKILRNETALNARGFGTLLTVVNEITNMTLKSTIKKKYMFL